jgi:hypothetical protein
MFSRMSHSVLPVNTEASPPEKADTVHLIVSTPGKAELYADVTREWPKGERKLDLGEVKVKR